MKLFSHNPLILFGLLHALRGEQGFQKLCCADYDISWREKDGNKEIFKRASGLQVDSNIYEFHHFSFPVIS